jgi:hypothetical protein
MRNQSWSAWRFRDEGWQRELWRLYDVIPELRFAANWVGSAVSRCEIFVADVDELGRVQGRSEEEDVAALSDTVLGGPAAKAEALRSLGINLTVAGEAYIVGKPTAAKDKWYILSSTEVRRRDGLLLWGDRKFPMFATEGVDLVTRVWTQHPSRIWCADSPARSCQPILLELERLTKFIFSQIDSRLIGAGLLLIPNGLDFPADDAQSTASETLMQRLAQAGAESLKGEGTAAAQVPLIVESDPEAIEGWKHITFATELSRQAVELRTEAIKRFGIGMDMPLEALTGMGDSNHWSGWFVNESGTKIHIEPLMTRVCDALSDVYLAPALKIMGKDPSRYTYQFSNAPLTVRPERLTEAINLYNLNLLSAEAVREEGNFSESQAPMPEETITRFIKDLMLRDPTLFQAAGVRDLIGITEEVLPPELATPPPPPPAPAITGTATGLPPAIPERTTDTDPSLQAGLEADAGVGLRHDQLALVVLLDAMVRRALERAGGKLLQRGVQKRQFADIPSHELHTRIRVLGPDHAETLLTGAFAHLPDLVAYLAGGEDSSSARFANDPGGESSRLETFLHDYCAQRLLSATAHDAPTLAAAMDAHGLI